MRHSESDSDNEEGFYIPQIKFSEPEKPKENVSFNQMNEQQNADQANDLVFCQRPTDNAPRFLRGVTYTDYPPQLHANLSEIAFQQQPQQMVPINSEKMPKQKRYSSLKAKYQKNKDYQCVYSKIQNNQEFDGYIFSLQNTTDYNQDDYQIPIPEQPQLLENQNTNYRNSCPFNSKFQSGNLLYAFQIKNSVLKQYRNREDIFQYDLIMQNDTNTKGFNQWFYYSFKNLSAKKARFNIVNFIKKKLMFADGVRPVGFSMQNWRKCKQNNSKNQGWHTIGKNIHFKKSYITRQVQGPKGSPPVYKNYYTLSFDIQFPQENDTYYIAMNYPYTYSGMIKFVDRIVSTSPSNLDIKKNIICHTISNNPMPYLKIKAKQDFKQKGKILCLGRQHPGQTVGSFVLQTFVDEIIQKWRNQQRNNQRLYSAKQKNQQNRSEQQKQQQKQIKQIKKIERKSLKQKRNPDLQLLKHYQLIVIPMVNPDGVIYGNFRTNIAGFDLNRQWVSPNRWLQPQVFFLQKFLSSLNNVVFCMDFHGHSKKLNSFIYACVDEVISDFRVYPWIYNAQCPLFSIKDCTFSITPDKFRTARVNIFKQIQKPYVYTLQTAFFGYTSNGKNYRFKLKNFRQIGQGAAKAMQILFNQPKKVKKYQQQVKDKSYLFDQWAFFNKEDAGSESNPSEDELNQVQRQKKVMSEFASNKKISTKNNKKNRKKSLQKKYLKKIQELPKKKASQRSINVEKIVSLPPKRPTPQAVVKKQTQNKPKIKQTSTIILSQPKIAKPQKLQQKIRPPPVFPIKQTIKPGKSVPTKLQASQQKKKHSNLLDPSGYLKLRQQKIIQQVRSIRQSQSKLQLIVGDKYQGASFRDYHDFHISLMRPTQFKYSRKNVFDSSPSQSNIGQNKSRKMKQKIYIIKENKIVNSFTRINDEEIKQKLERQIKSRTNKLQKCQKAMSHLSSYQGGNSVFQQSKANERDKQLSLKTQSRVISQKSFIDQMINGDNFFHQHSQVFRTKTYLVPLTKDNQQGEKINILPSRHSQKIQRIKNF